MSNDNVQSILNRKLFYIFLTILLICFFVGILTSAMGMFGKFELGHDFRYFHEAVNNFWNGESIYNQDEKGGFFYLNYFCILFFWMLLPEYFSFSIHLIITFTMFYFILKNIETKYQEWWLYGNLIMIYWWSMLFNTNIWITFAFIMFLKYKDKWFSPLFLFLAFYKITTILVFILLYIIILYFEKKIKRNQILVLICVIIVSFISFLTSEGISINALASEDSFLFIQLPHYFWWSILILIFTQFKNYSTKTIIIFWMSYSIFEFLFSLYFLRILLT